MTKFFKTLLLVAAMGVVGCNISGSFIEECVANLLALFKLKGENRNSFSETVPTIYIGYFNHDTGEFVSSDKYTGGVSVLDRYLPAGTYDVVYWGNVGTKETVFADLIDPVEGINTRAEAKPRVTYKNTEGDIVGSVDRVWYAIMRGVTLIDTPTRVIERTEVEFTQGYRTVNVYIRSEHDDPKRPIDLANFGALQLTNLPISEDYYGEGPQNESTVTAEIQSKLTNVMGKTYKMVTFDTFRYEADDMKNIMIVVEDAQGEQLYTTSLYTAATRAGVPDLEAQSINIEMNILNSPTGVGEVEVEISIPSWETETVIPNFN